MAQTKGRPTWKESRIVFASATLTALDGPGDEYLLVLRAFRANGGSRSRSKRHGQTIPKSSKR